MRINTLPKTFRCLECPNVANTLDEARDHAEAEGHWAWGVTYSKEVKQ